ncbi:MAG: response regulator transcription factor [Aggregatilineales bacterium]
MDRISILIADDHAVLRVGLRMLLDAQPDMVVVGDVGSGTELLARAEALRPMLILLDLSMPGLGGLQVLPLLRKMVPQTRILVLTMHDDESYLAQALRDGASGYVLKKAADNELVAAIHAVMRGDVYVHPSFTRSLLDDILPAETSTSSPWEGLSEREREVLLLVARGYTSAKIGEQLCISPKTVDTYRARGMEKLGIRSRAALVQFVLTNGLLVDDLT